jgi:hypothetical protein
MSARRTLVVFSSFLALFLTGSLRAQILSVQVGQPPPTSSFSTNTLVAHGDPWHWRRGTNEPQADWRTALDTGLDATWDVAPGGVGYGDPGIIGEATTVNGMINVHTTLYIRKSFTVPTALETGAQLFLRSDYDDGFVAYIDGTEVARLNVPGAVGSPVAANATTGGNSHEASCCNTPNPATNVLLGAATLLAPGDHILALVGVNQVASSSDFHLIMDLQAITSTGINPPPADVVSYPGYAISTTNIVTLTGSNTVPATVRVSVNGDEAAFNSGNGTWSLNYVLRPGWNDLYIAAHDATGAIAADLRQPVIYETQAVRLGGTLASTTLLNTPGTVLYVTNSLAIPTGLTLELADGVVVLATPGQSLIAHAGGRLFVHGTDASRVHLWPFGGTNSIWGPVSATGAGASVEIHFADISHSQYSATQGATGLFEDSDLHDFDNPSGGLLGRPLMMANFASSFIARRNHFSGYYECLVRNGVIQVEDSLFEHITGDGLDFDSAQPGSYVRRCTYRHGNLGNVDAVDIGPGGSPGDLTGTIDTAIDSCLMWDFPFDKGVSIGDNGSAHGIVVTNCLVYGCDSGVAVKDSCEATIIGCTFVSDDFGLNLKAKFPATPPGIGGLVSNSFNNIIWDNAFFQIWVTNSAYIAADFSDIMGTNWPGTGNLSADPLFVDPARRDYRLQPGSPCIGTGRDGATMGVHFPIGGIGRPPLRLAALAPTTNSITLTWTDDTENEDGVLVERSLDGVTWAVVGMAPMNATTHTDIGLAEDTTYSYRVRTTNSVGISPAGNLAKATTRSTTTSVGGTLTENTTWSGTVLVTSSVTVPGPLTLTILPGTNVKLTNTVSITASGGGHIEVQGDEAHPVVFQRVNTAFTRWGDLGATGAGSTLTVRHANITRGRVRANSGGTTLVEDSELSDMTTTGIIGGSGGALFTVRRSYVHNYEDIDLVGTKTLAEDSLFERANSDIFELQGSPSGSILRRCTFRECLNPNSDGVDMNGCHDVLIDSCMIYDVTDKGISSGSATSASDPTSVGLIVTNTLIHTAAIGIAIKDNGTAALYNNTIADVTDGIFAYGKFTTLGGHVTNGFNNLVWNVTTAVHLNNGADAVLTYSDFQHTNFPGAGNISADPSWQKPQANDYRLLADSPCLGTGLGGANMGASFPLGAPMAPSHPSLDFLARPDGLRLEFWADSAKTTTLETSETLEAGVWGTVMVNSGLARPQRVVVELTPGSPAFYRVKAE